MLQLYHDYLDYKEEADFIRHSAEDYDDARFKEKQARFGTVVLECDLDMEPSEIYEAYSKRWEIETVMRYYKPGLRVRRDARAQRLFRLRKRVRQLPFVASHIQDPQRFREKKSP